MIADIYKQTKFNIKKFNLNTFQDVENHSGFVVEFSKEMQDNSKIIKNFLFENVYNHRSLLLKRQKVETIIIKLFNYFYTNSNKLPSDWINNSDLPIERIICDYISGMTDRYASRLYKEIYD